VRLSRLGDDKYATRLKNGEENIYDGLEIYFNRRLLAFGIVRMSAAFQRPRNAPSQGVETDKFRRTSRKDVHDKTYRVRCAGGAIADSCSLWTGPPLWRHFHIAKGDVAGVIVAIQGCETV
jgi:hypothetical protein